MTDPLIGRQLANFRIERLLGSGGMAQVYYGLDVKLQRPVAIKVIDARFRDNPMYAKRFVKEARVMAKWRHEHIVQIYYADNEDGIYYYVMEYLDGQDLASVMESMAESGKRLSTAAILKIGRAVASALDYAHQRGVIHRDVKPSNIFMATDGRIALGDFGLALDREVGSIGEVFGTPHYISPEQASESDNAIPQSDLYSLGIILYEMLTGAVPFDGPTPAGIALQHVADTPPPPHRINPELPPSVDAVLLKALDKQPANRYPSGKELMDALEKALREPSVPVAKKLPLPPVPVGVPTVKSNLQEADASGSDEVAPTVKSGAVLQGDLPTNPALRAITKKQPVRYWPIIILLVTTAGLLFSWQTDWFSSIPMGIGTAASPTLITATVSSPQDSVQAVPVAADTKTSTVTPILPTATFQSTPTSTVTPLSPSGPAGTATSTSPPTATLSPWPTVSLTPTIGTPDGILIHLYYDDNSLYIHNLSKTTRSISGFSFERLDDKGNVLNTFGGWLWSAHYENLLGGRCMAVELYNSSPYLKPRECRKFYLLSIINPNRSDDVVFWTTQDNSHEFRVLWLDKEVARCEISAGSCAFYIP